MLRSLLTNIQVFFSSEKAVMSVGLGSTFHLLGLYYRIVVSHKRLRLELSKSHNVREKGEEEHMPDCTIVVKELIRKFMGSTLCSCNNNFFII